jgi:NAD(P)-dependent dehydrogenase (short-subunit alcohol dehydrogenase family)
MLTATAKATITPAVHEMMLKYTLTPRLGAPEDIAYTVAFLVSDEAAFITGQVIPVDGGIFAHVPSSGETAIIGATKHGNG